MTGSSLTLPATDADLVLAARRGDARALDAIVTRYEPRVYRFSYRLTGNADDAADVAQDTLMAMARALGTFRGEAALSTWLYRVAHRSAIKKFRQRTRQLAREVSLDEAEGGPARALRSPAPTPEELTASHERDAVINQALLRLSPIHREVLLLRDVEGLSAPEVAKVLGLGVRAVKSRLHRARLNLRVLLAPLVDGVHESPVKTGCRDVVTQFSRSLEGELGPSTCAELEAHVKKCAECRSKCASLKKALTLCRQSPRRDLPPALKRSLQRAVRQARAETSR